MTAAFAPAAEETPAPPAPPQLPAGAGKEPVSGGLENRVARLESALADVLALELSPREVVTAALREHAAGTYEMHPKIGVHPTFTNGDDQLVWKEWFKPGAFAVGIEGGCAFTAEALHAADKFLVDDVALAEYFDRLGRDRVTADGRPDPEFPGGMPAIHATIGEVVAGVKPGRESPSEQIITVPIGMSICDIALAQLAYRRALDRGIGQPFRLL